MTILEVKKEPNTENKPNKSLLSSWASWPEMQGENSVPYVSLFFKVKLTSLEVRKRCSGIISVLFTVLHMPWGRVTATVFFFFLPHHTTCEDLSSETRDWKHWVLCLVAQSCPTVYKSLDHSLPGSPLHGDSTGKNTGVGCHALLQGIFSNQEDQPLGIP